MLKDNIKSSVTRLFYNYKDYVHNAIQSVWMRKVNFKYELLIGEE